MFVQLKSCQESNYHTWYICWTQLNTQQNTEHRRKILKVSLVWKTHNIRSPSLLFLVLKEVRNEELEMSLTEIFSLCQFDKIFLVFWNILCSSHWCCSYFRDIAQGIFNKTRSRTPQYSLYLCRYFNWLSYKGRRNVDSLCIKKYRSLFFYYSF